MDNLSRMVIKRIALGLVTLFVISILIFQGVELLPGDAAEAILGQEATAETVDAFRKELKLDLPPHVRYFHWLGDFLQGDLGNSLSNGRPIADLIVVLQKVNKCRRRQGQARLTTWGAATELRRFTLIGKTLSQAAT